MASLLKNLALPFDSSKTYKFGDRFISGGHMYQVMESFNGSLDMTKVIEVTLADLVKGGYPPYESFAGISVEAASVSSDDENTYFGIPKPGFYNEQSKIFTSNSNLVKLLWTNSSPTSAFAAQTINLDLSKYNYIIVEFLSNTSYQVIRSRTILNKNDTDYFGAGFTTTNSYTRNVSFNDTGVTFGVGKMDTTANNTNVVPYKIYGCIITLF